MISKDPSIELMLYLSAQRQISVAMDLFNLTTTTNELCGILVGNDTSLLTKSFDLLLGAHKLKVNNPEINKNEVSLQKIQENLNLQSFSCFDEIEGSLLSKIALLSLE